MKRFNSTLLSPVAVLLGLLAAQFLVPSYLRSEAIKSRAKRKEVNITQAQAYIKNLREVEDTSSRINLIQSILDSEFDATFAIYVYDQPLTDRSAPLLFKPYAEAAPGLHGASRAGESHEWEALIEVFPEIAIAKKFHDEQKKDESVPYAPRGHLFKYGGQQYQAVIRPVSSDEKYEIWFITNLSASTAKDHQIVSRALNLILLFVLALKAFQTFQSSIPIVSLRRQVDKGHRIKLPAIAANELKALAESFNQAQAANKEAKELAEAVINSIPNALVFIKNEQYEYVIANPLLKEVSGLGEDIIGKTDFDAGWTKEEAKSYRRDDAQVFEKGSKRDYLKLRTQKDGSEAWFNKNKLLIHVNGSPHVFGIAQDVTKLIKAQEREERLREESEHQQKQLEYQLKFLQTVADAPSPDIIMWAKDLDHRFIFVNQALVDLAFGEPGHRPDEMIGKTAIGQGWWPDEEEYTFWSDDEHVTTTGEKITGDEKMGIDEKGRIRTQRVIKVPDNPKKPTCSIGVAFITTDLTEATRMAKEQAEEIETINHLASHDVKAQIIATRKSGQFIKRLLEQLKETDKSNEFTKAQVAKILPWVERIIVGDGNSFDLLDQRNKMFDLEANLQKKECLISDIVQKVESVIAYSGFRLTNDCAEDAKVMTDEIYLNRVLGNLINNGFNHNKSAAPVVTLCISESADAFAFKVEDNGIGMAPDDVKQIGEKLGKAAQFNAESKGSGAGWYGIRKILSAMEYEYEISSTLGEGTIVTITVSKHG